METILRNNVSTQPSCGKFIFTEKSVSYDFVHALNDREENCENLKWAGRGNVRPKKRVSSTVNESPPVWFIDIIMLLYTIHGASRARSVDFWKPQW